MVDLYAANMGAGTSGNRGETDAGDGETIGQMWERFSATTANNSKTLSKHEGC
jgi:hypothetical protein